MTIIRHIPQTSTDTKKIPGIQAAKLKGFTFDEAALKLADEITLGDLLTCGSLDERTIAGVLMLISYARTNLFNSVGKTDEEKANNFCGLEYELMVEGVHNALKNIDKIVPDYKGQGYEIAGFVWFQGWNDMINAQYTAEYADNMANFIRDVRKDLKAPKLPFVIGQLGVGGVEEEPSPKKKALMPRCQPWVSSWLFQFSGAFMIGSWG